MAHSMNRHRVYVFFLLMLPYQSYLPVKYHLPELAVTKSEDGEEIVRNVDYEKLTVLLVSEVQSLRKEVNDLRRDR